jgi:para-nitrobenzyl esterase
MKKNLCLLLLVIVTTVYTQAQNQGCDGTRYKDDVFTSVKKTTLVYGPTTDHLNQIVNLSMDVYEPEGDQLAARPVVVLAHGGSFILGDKSQMKRWCELLAKKGYVAASIQYRLYPFLVFGFPDSTDIFDTAAKAIGDMKAAVRFFRMDAATNNQFRVDINNVFVGGYSAGAVTALHTVYMDADDNIPSFLQNLLTANGGLEGNTGTAANKTYYSGSRAVINMSGGLYRREWIENGEVPMVSIHGDTDETVNYNYGLAANIAYLEGSNLLHGQANAVGLWNHLTTVPGGGHTNTYDQPQFAPYVDAFWVKTTTLLDSLICLSSSTHQPELREDWAMSPNPLQGATFQISLPDDVSSVTLTLLDAHGKRVFEQQNVNNQAVVTIKDLPAGIYQTVLNAEEQRQHFAAKRLVKL